MCSNAPTVYLTGEQAQKEKVVGFAKTLGHEDLYEMDQYWLLLLYQLFKDGIISDPYSSGSSEGTSFSIMESEGVDFVRPLT